MNDASTFCDPQRLRLLLAEQLSDVHEAEACAHLSQCDSCRKQLEALAGSPKLWAEIQQSMKSDPTLSTRGESPEDAPGAETDSESFTADFAVDFLSPSEDPQSLGRIDDYEIREVIGRGAMGVVLKGYQRDLGRFVAVKVMSPHLANSGAARKRFAREARAAAAIVHPHVMAIHAVDPQARLPYLVMPYVACESLQQRIDREGPLALQEILRVGTQTAMGLAAAHAQGLVHRDVKPANLLLEKGVDRVMITDFGLARAVDDASLTRTGMIAGTPQYMSPEQARGDAVDFRTDLFSLGSVLYAMCTGHPPFRAETSYGVIRRICDTRPRDVQEVNPDVPHWLNTIIARLHEKSPHHRLSSAEEAARLLESCLAHVQQPTVSPLPASLQPPPPQATRRSLPRWMAAIGCGLLALASAVWFARNQNGRDNVDNSNSPKQPQQEQSADQPSRQHEQSLATTADEPAVTSSSSDASWHDNEIETRLHSLGQQLQQFEAQSEPLWPLPADANTTDAAAP